jgi:hypothetical protein
VNDQTFQFLSSMPKGAVLHIHSGSSGSVDWLVNEGLSMEGVCLSIIAFIFYLSSLYNLNFGFRFLK